MVKAEFLKELGSILEVEADTLTDDHEIEPMYWDSIEIFGTIALIDKAGNTVKVASILSCEKVGDILDLAGCR